MGAFYEENGTFAKATEFYSKSLKIREKMFGHDDNETASAYGNLAGVAKEMKEYEKAKEYYMKDIEISEKNGMLRIC